jgi:tetratricopeptide (TPR) repeat protein
MGETLNLLFRSREDGTYELQVKENWSGRTVCGNFVPPYTHKQINALLKKLNNLDYSNRELREIGLRLFQALCGSSASHSNTEDMAEQSVQAILRSVIQRTVRRRGTVALTFCFAPGCDEFVRYPWELLHNDDHFLLVSGIFTLTRALLYPDMPGGCELPVHLPMRVLYIGASPVDCAPLETEESFHALERGLSPLIETGQVLLDRLEPATFDQLVRYLSSYGGAGILNDSNTAIPCYVVHFDGHGAYGRLCPRDECETVNEADARKCAECGASLSRIKPQTYLCFCNDEGYNRFIDTQSLRNLFLSSDVRLGVFSACETAAVSVDQNLSQRRQIAVDATLATALVTAQVPAVVAMPFSLQDDLSPTFMYHFYEALADGRMLEEALARARQALLPMQQKSWFIPVLYRRVVEGDEGPVALIASPHMAQEREHPLAHLGTPTTFIGRERELRDLEELLTAAATGEMRADTTGRLRLRSGTHHIALTGSAGIGKSALAFEAVRRNQEKFPGGIVGVSLQGGKSFSDALLEIIHYLRVPTRVIPANDVNRRMRLVQGSLRSLASRELPCLILLDSFEEVKDRAELEIWLQFLCTLPDEVVVLLTSRSNPQSVMIREGSHCRWYEYRVTKMLDSDLLQLFTELARENGLDLRIQLDETRQQAVLREICTLLDGYPLGAELIFGAARTIGGKVYEPEAATRSLEEIRDELKNSPLAGILAVLEVSYQRLTPLARLLLSYLAAFRLPFSREQIMLLVAPETLVTSDQAYRFASERPVQSGQEKSAGEEMVRMAQLVSNWSAARDELVQASFMQFDGRVYTIHPQVRHFAITHLPIEERRRVHRVVAAYYYNQPHPSSEEWFAAFEHLEQAGERQDIGEAIRIAVQAAKVLSERGYASELLVMLRKAGMHASRLGDRSAEGQVQCRLGSILRLLGQYTEAEACLRSSLECHRQQQEHEATAWTLYELAVLFREEGNFRLARQYAQEALILFQQEGHVEGQMWVQLVLGEVDRGCGRFTEAYKRFEQALVSFQDLHNLKGCAFAWRSRGTVNGVWGYYTKALHDYEEALRIFNTLDLRVGQAWVLSDMGMIFADRGELSRAEQVCREAIDLFREQGVRRGEAWVLWLSGDIYRERCDLMQARASYEQALELFRVVGDRVDQARVFNALGAIALEEGEYLEAKGWYEQAQAIADEQEVRPLDGRARRGLGDVARGLRRFTDANRYYSEAAAIAAELNMPAEQCAVLRRQGTLSYIQERYQEALAYWVQALALDLRLGHPLRASFQQKVEALVADQHLEEEYRNLSKRYGL